MAASRTRRPAPGGAEAEVMSEIGFAVAIVTLTILGKSMLKR
jgi:hypothetical protein